MEKTYAFIKDGIVQNVSVFTDKDDKLAKLITKEQGYDSFVYIGEEPDPARWSTYDGETFIPPTDEYLISIGVLDAVVDETISE
jgi:hypothetical protein